MLPVLTRIFGIPIYSYGLFLALAFLVCIILILRRAIHTGIAPHHILDLSLYIIISGIIGARLLYVILNLDYYIMHPVEIILLNKGGLVFYGGFILALITGILFIRKRKLPIWDIANIVILYLPLGQAIGRIGCFLNGCCYGRPTNSMFGVQFPEYSFTAGQFVHPTQIYSALIDVLIFLILGFTARHRIIYYMFLYGVARFLLEYFRADNIPVFYGLNVPQIISIILVLISYGRIQSYRRTRR